MVIIKIMCANGKLRRLLKQSLFIYEHKFVHLRPGGQIVKKLTFNLEVDFRIRVWYPNIEREVIKMKKSEFFRRLAEIERPYIGDWADEYIEIAEKLENNANDKQEKDTDNRNNQGD